MMCIDGSLLWQYLLERIGHQCLAERLHSHTMHPALTSCWGRGGGGGMLHTTMFLYNGETSLLLARASGTMSN